MYCKSFDRFHKNCILRLASIEYNRGIPQSILSASKQTSLEEALAHFGICERFAAVAGLDNHHAFGKVDLGQRLISTLAVDRRDILLIGDTVHDYEVAQAIGVACCLIPGGYQAYPCLAASGARVIESLVALFDSTDR